MIFLLFFNSLFDLLLKNVIDRVYNYSEKPEDTKEDKKTEATGKDPWWKPKDTDENLSRGTETCIFMVHFTLS